MSEIVISIEGLGKKYRIAHQVERAHYKTLRDTITLKVQHAFKAWRSRNGTKETRNTLREEFWALRDVSFDVMEGEVLGIIGRNGAGKSTLLKILSRITEPSRGRVRIRRSVASLLEVGTGFHPELTGRENIFLNGAILGMSKAEIGRKFDEIVAFSEVEKFLDTPVKRYSSGMSVRLAFAVAAHLEPEILIIDEVLAVGDASFQKKCLGKMQDVTRSGRTVIFVSHNMNAVEALCQRLIYLRRGELVETATDLRTTIAKYLIDDGNSNENSEWVNPGNSLRNPWFYPTRFYIGNGSGEVVREPVRNDSSVFVYIEGEVQDLDPALNVGYGLFDDRGQLLYLSAQTDSAEDKWPMLNKGWNRIRAQIPGRFLNQGDYRLTLLTALYHREWINNPEQGGPTISLTIQGGLSDSSYWTDEGPEFWLPSAIGNASTNAILDNAMNSKIAKYASLGCSLFDKAALGWFGVASLAANSRRYRRISELASSFPRMWLKPRQLRGLQLLVDPTDWSQIVIFDEIFLRSGYDLNKVGFIPDVIIDCGAHIGMFSLLAASTFPNVTVVTYEPNPRNVMLAHEQVKRNKLHIDIHQAAVSTSSTKMEFAAIVTNSHGGRLIHDVTPEIQRSKIETIVVDVVDLKSEIQKLKPERLLLKVDIEGEERRVLPDIVPMLPDRTALFFETHSGEPGWREIETLLRAHAFDVQQINARGDFFDGFALRA